MRSVGLHDGVGIPQGGFLDLKLTEIIDFQYDGGILESPGGYSKQPLSKRQLRSRAASKRARRARRHNRT